MAWNRKTNTRVSSKNVIANPVGVKQSIVFFSFSLLLAACGGDSGSGAKGSEPAEGDDDGREVATLVDMGRCTSEREGDTVYVTEKLTDFLCQNKTWVDLSEVANTSSSDADTNGKSSSSKGTEPPSIASSSSSVKDTESTSSSSFDKDAYTGNNLVVKDRSIFGVAQKGPFKFGSPVYLRELTKDKLEYTGMVYQDEINSNKGDFVIPKVNLISPYASIEVRGLYRNEITGDYSKDSISLFALTDLTTRTKVNVNLLTHLEYNRAMYLVRKGYNVEAAKKQASQEIMTAFELPTTVSSSEDLSVFEDAHDNNVNYANASLMMMSLLFLGERSDTEFKKTIDKFVQDFEKDGSWDDEETKAAMADLATEINGSEIRINVASWNVLSIPSFEAPLETFWNNVYGLGGCTVSRSGVVLKNKNAKSKNADVYYKCSGVHWVNATPLEYDTYGVACTMDGKLISGNVNSNNKYVCDAGSFRVPTAKEVEFNLGCTNYTRGAVDTTYVNPDTIEVWSCATTGEYELQYLLMEDTRDGKIYKTVTIGEQRWMAENLNYPDSLTYRGSCYKDSCAKYGRYYNWATAMDSAGVFSTNSLGCGNGVYYCPSVYPVRGICPSGWHLPDTEEWETLYSAMGSSPYAMQAKGFEEWPNAQDAFGFSAVPAGCPRKGYGSIEDIGSCAEFWTAVSATPISYGTTAYYAYSWWLHKDNAGLRDASSFNSSAFRSNIMSVRCLQDPN